MEPAARVQDRRITRRVLPKSLGQMRSVGSITFTMAVHMGIPVIILMCVLWRGAVGNIRPISTCLDRLSSLPDDMNVTVECELGNDVRVPLSLMSKNIAIWEKELENDKDRDFVLDGLRFGFHLTDDDKSPDSYYSTNYKSASTENKAASELQIQAEIDLGRYIVADHPSRNVSSLGAIVKKNGAIRLIHDFSRPDGGVNIYATDTSVKFPTVDEATRYMKPGCYLSKIDLESAYRFVPLHPKCYEQTGLKWFFGQDIEPTFLFDARLPFGAARSCKIFQTLTDCIVRMMARRGIITCGYIDDFMLICDDFKSCESALNILTELVASLGMSVNWKKVMGPTQDMTFLGVRIDTIKRTLALPEEKLADMKLLVDKWITKTKVTKLEVQQMMGRLNWCSRVVTGGKTFTRSIINLMCKAHSMHHYIRIGKAARNDLIWWQQALTLFHGDAPFICDIPEPAYTFSTDACLVGGAGHYERDWFYVDWAIDWPGLPVDNINLLELQCVLIAALRWGHTWSGRHIRVVSDNVSTVSAVNRSTSRSELLMPVVQELFWCSVLHKFRLSAVHIPGKDNVLSDRLSRLHDTNAALDARFLLTLNNVDFVSCKSHVTWNTFVSLQTHWLRGWPD
jgi:hypothetical protein